MGKVRLNLDRVVSDLFSGFSGSKKLMSDISTSRAKSIFNYGLKHGFLVENGKVYEPKPYYSIHGRRLEDASSQYRKVI